MRRRPVLSACLFLLTFLLIADTVFADTDRLSTSVADLYLEAASDSWTSGDAGEALHLAETALSYNPASSDGLYLRGLILSDDQARTRQALADLSSALVLDSFRDVNPARAALAYAALLYRTRQAQDALSVLAGLDRQVPEFDAKMEADALHLEARAARALERYPQANRALATGRARFPDDPRFLLLELLDEPAPGYRYRRELDRLLGAGAGDRNPALLEALLRYALTAPTAGEQEWAAERYIALGGDNPAVALAGGDAARSAIRFELLGGYARQDVFLALPDREAAAGAAAYTGESVTDADADGFWEERVTVRAGEVNRWETDRDQDGVAEVIVEFTAGEPVVLEMPQDGGARVEYERYPWVRAVTVTEDDRAVRRVARPFSLQVRALAQVPTGGPTLAVPVRLADEFSGVDLAAAELAAATVLILGRDGRVLEERVLDEGSLLRSRRDSDGDGSFDHLVVYRDGFPAAGLRDIDGDGYFEVAEAYDGGVLAAVVVDEDDNRTPDVVEYARDGGTREWDLDQDGRIDVREFGIWTERVRREFPFAEGGE